MTRFPIHPFTGLTAIGVRRDGRPIWPVLGGSGEPAPGVPPVPGPPPAPPPAPPAPPADPDDKPLGPNGEKALAAERLARKALEDQLAALAPLKDLAAALGGGKPGDGKTDIDRLNERFAQQEKALADERAARFRTEVALDKKLTPEQAALLVGATREDLAAHADQLLALFGKPAETGPAPRNGPRPDPAQGAQPGTKLSGREAALAEAARRFGPKKT